MSAACVVIPTSDEDYLRAKARKLTRKWAQCTPADAAFAVEILVQHAAAIGVLSVNKETAAWAKFVEDAKTVQTAIARRSRRRSRGPRASVHLAFWLLGGSSALALARALRRVRTPQITDRAGMKLVEPRYIFDAEISGTENVTMFESIINNGGRTRRIERLGFRVTPAGVRITSEQQEPLLLLADYAAGLSHSMLLSDPGRIPLPIPSNDANALLGSLRDEGKLVVKNSDFEHSFEEILGPLMILARESVAS